MFPRPRRTSITTDDARGSRFPGLFLVEGLPGSGKSSNAHRLALGLNGAGISAEHWGEGRPDHPVDFEQVSVLRAATLDRLIREFPSAREVLLASAERSGESWLIRDRESLAVPDALRDELRRYDGYDGEITPDVHSEVLLESWRRFGAAAPPSPVQIWECVAVQNPICAFVARFDESDETLERHVQGLLDAVGSHRPAMIYLDPGDPRPTLERAAAERPAEWLSSVIAYHCEQGYGLRAGLEGFDGYVEFMRRRRELELRVVERLPIPTLLVETSTEPAEQTAARILAFAGDHLGVDRD